jgi:cyanate permease
VLSINFSALGIGQTISLAFGPTLLNALGNWHNIYYLFECGMLCATLIWYLFGKEHPESHMEQGDRGLMAPLKVLREHRALWLVALCQGRGFDNIRIIYGVLAKFHDRHTGYDYRKYWSVI